MKVGVWEGGREGGGGGQGDKGCKGVLYEITPPTHFRKGSEMLIVFLI